MNSTTKIPQKSRVSHQNPYSATGLSDNSITSPIEDGISRITVNFGKISQNSLNFAALVCLATAQNPNTHQKTTATKARRGFTLN